MSVAEQVPLVERNTDPLANLPPAARELYSRRSCSLLEAVQFLGTLAPKRDGSGHITDCGGAAYARAKRYIERTGPIRARPPYDPNLLLPRMVRGEFVEIPCMKCGHYVVDTHLLVWCRYPSVSPW